MTRASCTASLAVPMAHIPMRTYSWTPLGISSAQPLKVGAAFMLRAAFACHVVQKPASRSCVGEGSREQRDGPDADFWTIFGKGESSGWLLLRIT